MKHGLLVLSLSFLAACASTPSTPDGAAAQTDPKTADANKGVVCVRETPMGSNMPKKRCTTTEQREQERRRAVDTMNQPSTSNRKSGAE